ncbi:hypothetical protein JYP52_22100 [Nitratireductor aquibiodomus]|uniref:hypothetical protein n=1 Tax=Nitratireductor aquibiodomus TaxID=204799 RepID=UPI0019D3FB8B|nr:hypothetical protein [Nitratireductor aquibiodomus]MBN7763835.1 hypothetical protein [Nitratireductor aquibiodomus]
MNPLSHWFAWLRAKRTARLVEKAERKRRAALRAKQYRKQKHMAFRYLDGDLRNATNASLAASCGREWRAR